MLAVSILGVNLLTYTKIIIFNTRARTRVDYFEAKPVINNCCLTVKSDHDISKFYNINPIIVRTVNL